LTLQSNRLHFIVSTVIANSQKPRSLSTDKNPCFQVDDPNPIWSVATELASKLEPFGSKFVSGPLFPPDILLAHLREDCCKNPEETESPLFASYPHVSLVFRFSRECNELNFIFSLRAYRIYPALDPDVFLESCELDDGVAYFIALQPALKAAFPITSDLESLVLLMGN
jgi:hypothetical protein